MFTQHIYSRSLCRWTLFRNFPTICIIVEFQVNLCPPALLFEPNHVADLLPNSLISCKCFSIFLFGTTYFFNLLLPPCHLFCKVLLLLNSKWAHIFLIMVQFLSSDMWKKVYNVWIYNICKSLHSILIYRNFAFTARWPKMM